LIFGSLDATDRWVSDDHSLVSIVIQIK
jgi:hypothetical protein